jgi:hypothetical protein
MISLVPENSPVFEVVEDLLLSAADGVDVGELGLGLDMQPQAHGGQQPVGEVERRRTGSVQAGTR